jgi:hypothetical protein
VETISNVQGDFFGESDMDYENRRNRPRHRREDAAQVPHFHAPPTIVGSSVWSRRTEAFGYSTVAAPIEILSHPLKLPKLVIRVFRHERFDAEPGLMWLRKTLRVVVANASQLQPPRSK